MSDETKKVTPESVLEAIGFVLDEDDNSWRWNSPNGQHMASINADDLKYVTVYEVMRDEEDADSIDDITPINHDYTIGEFIDQHIFNSTEE